MQALSVSRGITLLFSRTFGTKWGGGKLHSSAASTPGKDPVPILQEAGWAPGTVWMGGKSRLYRDYFLIHRIYVLRHQITTRTYSALRSCNTQLT